MKASVPHPVPVQRPRGFALVITLSLMVLVILLATGLLSLSTLSLRGASREQAMASARANARLALQLAIGDLQRSLGPDRAITAPSSIVAGERGRQGLTGVWESWSAEPGRGAPDYAAEKSSRFRRWLVSDSATTAVTRQDFAASPVADDSIPLVSAAGDDPEIRGGRVQLDGGSYAWHVGDEAVKARIDMHRDPTRNGTLADRRALVAGHRSGIRAVRGEKGMEFDFLPDDSTGEAFTAALTRSAALTGLPQADLMAGERIAHGLQRDLTTHSLGVLADARDGGLKRDLTSAFELPGGLPADLAGRKLYQSTHGVTGISDPFWSALSGYYNVHKQLRGTAGMPSFRLENADPVQIDRAVVPRNYQVTPVIAKFEVMFTFVVRDTHGPWIPELPRASGDTQKKYMMHMVYLPIVTLHNPYNVELEFERLNLVVRDIPVAFNFHVNGHAQNNRFVPFNEMFIVNTEGAAGEKAFMLDLANWQYPGETRPADTLKMKPGQTLVCGPYLDPAADSSLHLRGSAGTKDRFSNGDTSAAIKLRPGFAGKAVGMSVDWLTPPEFTSGQSTDGNLGILGLRMDDNIRIESAIRRPLRGVQDHWEVEATLVMKNKRVSYGGMRFHYGDESTLQRHFARTYSYPREGSMVASSLYEPYQKSLASQSRGKAVAMFTAAARTCFGGVYETLSREEQPGALNDLRDGRLAGKPYLHHNPARASILMDLRKDLPGRFTHELDFLPLKGELDDVLELDATNRGHALTGNTTTTGIKSGALFDLPAGPMQTIAGFRRSNALSSSHPPNFLQPVANSSVSPLMPTTDARDASTTSAVLLDHSYLANHALYDGHYFSTVSARGGQPAAEVFARFLARQDRLATQCYEPWQPAGGEPAQGARMLFSGASPTPDAWREMAAWQMVAGSFNVNSTRVLAWKAMLASLSGTDIPVLWAKSLGIENVPAGNGAAVAGMTLPLAGAATTANPDPLKIDNRRTQQWNGFRPLGEAQLDELARRIVEEVKARGPFLSMAEFVNRRLGPETPLTRQGALQAAIERSRVNDEVFADMVPVRSVDVADPMRYDYPTPTAATGNPAEGAPGWIMQGDLLHLLEPRATVRSDTFLIRACGEARDPQGRLLAKAYAEAVVQRVPDYIDPANPAAATGADLTVANRRFGRRLIVTSFRWLPAQAI